MTTPESTSPPRKRKGLRVALLVVGTVIVAGLVWSYGPRPDIVFEGRVLDAENAPLADVFVLVNVRSFTADFGHGHSGCAYGEVVKTDANGRFRFARPYNEVLGSKPNRTHSMEFGFYKPGWIPKGGWNRQSPGRGPDYLMIRDETSFTTRGGRLNGMLDNNCNFSIQGKGWPDLWAAIYRETYATYCDEVKPEFRDLSQGAFFYAIRLITEPIGLLSKQSDLSPLGVSRWDLERRANAMSAWLERDQQKFNIKFEGLKVVGPDITVGDKQRLCEIYRIDGDES